MQIDPFLLLVAVSIVVFFVRVLLVSIAIYFAGRIMAGEMIRYRHAVFGAVIVQIIHEIAFWISYFVVPNYADIIGLLAGTIALVVLIIRYYDFGIFSTIALVMLVLVMVAFLQYASRSIQYILLVPLP